MHELSIVQGVIDICEEHAKGSRVISVTLEIGALSGVVPEAVEFCFEAATRETLLDGASLHIERIPATAFCNSCKQIVNVSNCFDQCPSCAAFPLDMKSGEEMRVKELEVE